MTRIFSSDQLALVLVDKAGAPVQALRKPTKKAAVTTPEKQARRGTFTDNMKLPVHRWLRYSAGFSAEWVESLISEEFAQRKQVVLDPFAGSGTTLIASAKTGVKAYGYESHPFVYRLAQAKTSWHEIEPAAFHIAIAELIETATKREAEGDLVGTAPLLLKCYTPEALRSLFALKAAYLEFPDSQTHLKRLLWLAITSVLRACSHVGTAQWQYVLPNKRKAVTKVPYAALLTKADDIAFDILLAKKSGYLTNSEIFLHDARDQSCLANDSVDLVITSPPYPNNYDYADATRLEMTFWGEVSTWGDLQDAVRQYIVRSCSQHSAAEKLVLVELLQREELKPIASDLQEVCEKLGIVRLEKGGKKHTTRWWLHTSQTWPEYSSTCAESADREHACALSSATLHRMAFMFLSTSG